MGTLWCARLRMVAVPPGVTPKPVTLVYPYYENPRFFARQFEHWCRVREASPDLAAHLRVIVVDDGSPGQPARDILPGQSLDWLRLFELEVDVRWNWIAARNIGMRHAEDGWCLLTDMDHVVSAATLRAAVYGAHRSNVIYGFRRIDVKPDGTELEIAPHPNSWLMTRAMFWTVGGYDETLSGHYGTDGDWRRRCAATAPIQILTDALRRHEFEDDSSTSRYLRKQPEDAAVRQLIAARGAGWVPRTVSFPYHEVTR